MFAIDQLSIVSKSKDSFVFLDKSQEKTFIFKQFPMSSSDFFMLRSKLSHKNILKIIKTTSDSKKMISLIFENWDQNFKTELNSRYSTNNYYGEQELLNSLESSLEGLAHLHSNELIHSNIMFRKYNKINRSICNIK